jgi:PncC family amidohydrolase
MATTSRTSATTGEPAPEATRVGELMARQQLTIATAESMTGGAVAEALVAVPGASEWLAGGVIAYMSRVKYDLLGVRKGPVVNEEAVRQMAPSAARLLETDVGVATSGVAGPAPMEGQPVGTLWIAVSVRGQVVARYHKFDGEPAEIRVQAVRAALELTAEALEAHGEVAARS